MKFIHLIFDKCIQPVLHACGFELLRYSRSRKDDCWPKLLECCQKLDPAVLQTISTPKRHTIWQFWWQGVENTPALVRSCMASVRKWANGWEVVVIDERNVDEYVDIPPFIREKHLAGIISHTHFSDYLRAKLLAQYGGVWIDASVLLTAPIPEEILSAKFFMFKASLWAHPSEIPEISMLRRTVRVAGKEVLGGGESAGSSWFLVGDAGCLILSGVVRLMEGYWQIENSLCDYFLFHRFLTLLVCMEQRCREEYLMMPCRINIKPHLLQFSLFEPFRSELWESFSRQSFAHKLTQKFAEPFPPKSFGQTIERGEV